MVLDQYDDNWATIFNKAPAYACQLVKTAVDATQLDTTDMSNYALAVELSDGSLAGKFPIVDLENSVVSSAYFSEYGHQLPIKLQKQAAARLSEALSSHGVNAPVELTKTASMVESGDDGIRLEDFFKLESDEHIIEDAFKDCSPRGKRRIVIETRLTKLASMYPAGTELGSDLAMAIDIRKLFVKHDDDSLKILDYFMEKSASVDPAELVVALEAFDTTRQLVHLYRKGIPDPYESVYGDLLKQATDSVEERVELPGHDAMGRGEFMELVDSNKSKLEETFGAGLVSQLVSDHVTVYNSLPMPYKSAIANVIKG